VKRLQANGFVERLQSNGLRLAVTGDNGQWPFAIPSHVDSSSDMALGRAVSPPLDTFDGASIEPQGKAMERPLRT